MVRVDTIWQSSRFLARRSSALCRRQKKIMMAIKPKISSATAPTMTSDAVLMTLFETLYEKTKYIKWI
jgi:hypothetical protein